MSFEVIVCLIVLIFIAGYHIFIDYNQRKKTVNVNEDAFKIEEKLSKLTGDMIEVEKKWAILMNNMQQDISNVIKTAIIECTLPDEYKKELLNSIKTAAYDDIEEVPEETIIVEESAHKKLRALMKKSS